MTYSFTRVRIATGLAVALTWFGQQAAWADCYDSGFNDGKNSCPICPSLPNCQEGDYDKGRQDGINSVKLPNCQEGDYDKGRQDGINSVKPPNCQEGDYEKGLAAGKNSCPSLPNCKESDYQNGYQSGLNEGKNSCSTCPTCPSLPNCTEKDYQNGWDAEKKSCDSEKDSLNSQLLSCNTEKGKLSSQLSGLITQDACTAQYKDYITKDQCTVSTEAICKSTYTTTLFTQTELDTQKTAAIAQCTGYVENETAKSCKDVTPDAKAQDGTKEKQCADKLGFDTGYKEGQLSLAGYTTEANGETVAKPCVKDSSGTLPRECKSSLKGFQDGYELGEKTTTANQQMMTVEQCQQNPDSCTNQDFKAGRDTGKAEATAQYTGYVDDKGVAKSCSESTADQTECAKNQGFTDGYNAHDTLADCTKNPQPCMIAYLQGFYDYFVQKRLQNVNDKETSFPTSLTVKPLGGPDDNTPADQWRYTWKTKTKGCDALKSGERFKPLQDDKLELSICLEQEDDMGKETDSAKTNFGSSKDEKKLESNQSLGYTVYLMDGEQVKATMEIIFSPDSKTATANTPVTEGGTTSDTTGGTADTAAAGADTDATETESTTSDTGKTN